MLPIYICEDMEEELRYFKNIIEKAITENYLDAGVVCAARAPQQLIERLDIGRQQSLYFLDIDLKSDMDGIELSKVIRKYDPRGFIVMITTHDNLSPLMFQYRVEAMDFIVKDKDDVKGRILACIKSALDLQGGYEREVKKYKLRVEGCSLFYAADEIYSFEATRHGVILHMNFKSALIESTLSELQNELDESFYRCHKSCIVNLVHVIGVDRSNRKALLDNGRDCEVSARLMKPFEKYYDRYIEERQAR